MSASAPTAETPHEGETSTLAPSREVSPRRIWWRSPRWPRPYSPDRPYLLRSENGLFGQRAAELGPQNGVGLFRATPLSEICIRFSDRAAPMQTARGALGAACQFRDLSRGPSRSAHTAPVSARPEWQLASGVQPVGVNGLLAVESFGGRPTQGAHAIKKYSLYFETLKSFSTVPRADF